MMSIAIGILMLFILLTAFAAMVRYDVAQSLAMPLVACVFLALSPRHARVILEAGFHEFAAVAVLFTAVAIPAHMVARSGAFAWLGARLGRRIGVIGLRHPRLAIPLLAVSVLLTTYVTAALFHNITSILVTVPIAIGLCRTYRVPSRWLLSGQLIASNLGGFSTSWGDTPNIIEAGVWGLTNRDFMAEIVPPNLALLLTLSLVVVLLTRRDQSRTAPRHDPLEMAIAAAGFDTYPIAIDRRLLTAGLITLTFFIVVQYGWRQFEIAAGVVTILAAVLLERGEDRLRTLQTLEFDLYLVLLSIFILAGAVEQCWLGAQLRQVVQTTGGSPFAIALSGYLGTMFTEAASWASAAARPTHAVNSLHGGAWALGAGICAGSSALITAASAGIVLSVESRRFPGHEITFRGYLPFGLAASITMLAFYSLYFSVVR